MTQLRRNSFRDFEDIFARYNRARYNRFFTVPASAAAQASARPAQADWLPAVDIVERENAFAVSVELPGVSKEDVKVSLEKRVLSITGERRLQAEEGGVQHRHIERAYGNFSRSFTLPENVDEAAIAASYKDGVLSLTIPKAARPEPRSIEVKIH